MMSFIRAITLPLLFLFMSGFGPTQTPQDAPKDVHVSIAKVENVWKVVLTGTTITEVHVVEGQKIIFHAEGTDVYLQFDDTNLFGGHLKMIKNGKTLVLGVGQVEKGVYTYSAFCDGPKVFAVGDSPPKIIVD